MLPLPVCECRNCSAVSTLLHLLFLWMWDWKGGSGRHPLWYMNTLHEFSQKNKWLDAILGAPVLWFLVILWRQIGLIQLCSRFLAQCRFWIWKFRALVDLMTWFSVTDSGYLEICDTRTLLEIWTRWSNSEWPDLQLVAATWVTLGAIFWVILLLLGQLLTWDLIQFWAQLVMLWTRWSNLLEYKQRDLICNLV